MSGFSESFHLKTWDPNKAATLLMDVEMSGYVCSERNGWVTFVVDYRGRDVDKILSEFNPGLLVYYVYLEDHMWIFKIYNKDELVFDYEANWAGESLLIEKRLFDLDLLQEMIRLQGNLTDDLEQVFDFTDNKISNENPPAYLIAQKLGLDHYEWISLDRVSDLNQNQLKELGIIEVES
ncbi:hypothetical protein FHS18_004963 [Paenibacillus phyllosphaerae]|uniref:Uncharacterized protein n=1 Tax=Paenibacillus phyllosphaerae TaxID=274593 RepID=A0A7W5B2T8_9BACL|nr:hypothetical protein [Paenibacillus phyllosphaerae]MBB3112861.1 hypothetical protein [Paenibacillus phyllosphaerae]